jgi:hypothetical protein
MMDDHVVWSSPWALAEWIGSKVGFHLLVVHIDDVKLYALVGVSQLGRLCGYQSLHVSRCGVQEPRSLIAYISRHTCPAADGEVVDCGLGHCAECTRSSS